MKYFKELCPIFKKVKTACQDATEILIFWTLQRLSFRHILLQYLRYVPKVYISAYAFKIALKQTHFSHQHFITRQT